MKELVCTVCEGPRENGRKQCHECYKKAARSRSKKRYDNGIRTRYSKICAVCGDPYVTTHKQSRLCLDCYYQSRRKVKCSTRYVFSGKNTRLHREIAERVLHRKLKTAEHLHHLDGCGRNNSLKNLIVLSIEDHTRLHRYLDIELAVLGRNAPLSEDALRTARKTLALSFLFEKDISTIRLWKT